MAKAKTISAQIFMRASDRSKSIRNLGIAPLPKNLKPYQAKASDRGKAVVSLQEMGFRVIEDSMGLTLTIEGTARQFQKHFGASSGEASIPEVLRETVEALEWSMPPTLF